MIIRKKSGEIKKIICNGKEFNTYRKKWWKFWKKEYYCEKFYPDEHKKKDETGTFQYVDGDKNIEITFRVIGSRYI